MSEPTTILIFVPDRRHYEARAEIARTLWIFEIDAKWETISVDEFVAKWGSEGWDTVEFVERLMAAGYKAIAEYRGLSKREHKEFTRLIEDSSGAAKARAEHDAGK